MKEATREKEEKPEYYAKESRRKLGRVQQYSRTLPAVKDSG